MGDSTLKFQLHKEVQIELNRQSTDLMYSSKTANKTRTFDPKEPRVARSKLRSTEIRIEKFIPEVNRIIGRVIGYIFKCILNKDILII